MKEGLIASVDFRQGPTVFQAKERLLQIDPTPPNNPGFFIAHLRRLIGVRRDFALQRVASIENAPCVYRVETDDPQGGRLKALKGELEDLGVTNPIHFTTQEDIVWALDRLGSWNLWSEFVVQNDERSLVEFEIDKGTSDEGASLERATSGRAVIELLKGLVIGVPAGRLIHVRMFHNEDAASFYRRLNTEAANRDFAGKFLVIGGCPVDHVELLKLQHAAIAGDALGVITPFEEQIDPRAFALAMRALHDRPELLRNVAPGDAIRRGYRAAADTLRSCLQKDDASAVTEVLRAFTPAAAPFFEQAKRFHRAKLQDLLGRLEAQEGWYLDFVEANDRLASDIAFAA
ncbi:hypothetical protein [Singulisphaera acidiphila]|nr:hypothetical protein [Singulisphaera acidiphila]